MDPLFIAGVAAFLLARKPASPGERPIIRDEGYKGSFTAPPGSSNASAAGSFGSAHPTPGPIGNGYGDAPGGWSKPTTGTKPSDQATGSATGPAGFVPARPPNLTGAAYRFGPPPRGELVLR